MVGPSPKCSLPILRDGQAVALTPSISMMNQRTGYRDGTRE